MRCLSAAGLVSSAEEASSEACVGAGRSADDEEEPEPEPDPDPETAVRSCFGTVFAATMIRVIHHMADVPAVLAQVRRILVPGGTFILEYANKRNLKAMVRHARKQQTWNPYDLTPVEFVELNFDFHPNYMRQALQSAGFTTKKRIPVSYLRLQGLKERLSTETLVRIDRVLQHSGLLYSPSIFTRNVAVGETPDNLARETLFACPDCGGPLARDGDVVRCRRDGQRWAVRDGIYDFKAPLET